MSWESLLFIAGFLGVALALIGAVHTAETDERVATFAFGEFTGLRGPGLFFCVPEIQKLVRIRLGDVGTVNSKGAVVIGGFAVPFVASMSLIAGARVRITGFESTAVRVELDRTAAVARREGG